MPAVLFAAVFFVLPLIGVVGMSLSDIGPGGGISGFAGLSNYLAVLRGAAGETFRGSLGRTAVYAFLKLLLSVIPALFIAALIDRRPPFAGLCLMACAAPLLIPASVTGLIFRWLYDPNIGPLNAALGALGLPQSRWLYGESSALLCVTVFSAWRNIGLHVLIFTAGLRLIPKPLLEAARLDGCAEGSIFRRIKFPLLKPFLLFAAGIDLIDSLRTFTDTHILTPDGGPLKSTTLMVNAIYELAIRQGRPGHASAAAVILLLIALLLAPAIRLPRRLAEGRGRRL